MIKIELSSGYAEVPDDVKIVDLSNGSAVDAGVILDSRGELPKFIVIAGESLRGLLPSDNERIIQAAIVNMPDYCALKAQELPYPTSDSDLSDWICWNDSCFIRLYPLKMLSEMECDGYRLIEPCMKVVRDE